MNFFVHKLSIGAMSLLALSVQPVYAATSAQAHIDWNGINVTYFDLSDGSNVPLLTWSTQYGQIDSYAYSGSNGDYQNDAQSAADFISSLSAATTTINAQSSTLRDGDDLNAYAASQVGFASLLDSNYAAATAYNFGSFQVTGFGLALISIDWSITGSHDAADFSSYSSAQVALAAEYTDGNGNVGKNTGGGNDTAGSGSEFSRSGTFTITLFSDGVHGVTGNLAAQASVYSFSPVSQVPLPAAAWMFGSGLLGLLTAVGRKSGAV
ncbi:VPLPA-CTERM sorting domain-containing protein [Methylomonas sp. HYX-M1]|uniref:VPLPA-CTERM sorting domain-containing protein n=1 Tax=Methylomonas sp. HYX-M1 TaxID=3139307 RepID=UPI00345C3B2E